MSDLPQNIDPETALRRRRYLTERRRVIIQIALFILTGISTTAVGGFAYGATLMSILLAHEFGHYFTAKRYGVKATLPYFLPFPNLFGTFGAVIKMQGFIPNRRALFDIGLMGPAMGLVIALPATVVGIVLSKIQPTAELVDKSIGLGDSLLFMGLTRLIHGPMPEGTDLLLHPIGFAGWAGLLVTALNLLPLGQLDGGHVIYALFRQRSLWIYRSIFLLLVATTVFFGHQWIAFLLIVFFLIRLQHPPTLDDAQPIGRTRAVLGVAALLFFLLTFPPAPIKF